MAIRIVDENEGPVMTAGRMKDLTEERGKTVIRTIIEGNGPSREDIRDASFHKSRIPLDYFVLTFCLAYGDDEFDLHVTLNGVFGLLEDRPLELFGRIYREQAKQIFELRSNLEVVPGWTTDVYVRFDPRRRVGYVRLYKEADAKIQAMLPEQRERRKQHTLSA
jgi:hypothetical protein